MARPTAARRSLSPLRVLACVALFLAGMATRTLFAGHPASQNEPSVTPRRAAARTDVAQIGPTRTQAGMPAGFAHTQPGAIAAAVSYVTTGQALLDLDPLGVERAVRAMAAAAAADGQVAETQAKLAAARRALADGTGPTVYRQGAIAVRVDAYTPERARVAVWSVGVLARASVAPPQAGWSTSTFELVWERGDWKVWSETITPGPAPIPNDAAPPASAAELEADLAGFTDLRAGP